MTKPVILWICMIFCTVSKASGQRYACDGQLLIAAYDGQRTTIWRPVFIPFGIPFLSPITLYRDRQLDAIGFNPEDFYLYGVDQETNAVNRMRRDGTVEEVGNFEGRTTRPVLAGDCTPDGRYACHDGSRHQIHIYQVVEGFGLVDQIDLFWDPESGLSGPCTSVFYDIAVDPNRLGIAYAFQGSSPTLGPVASSGAVVEIIIDPEDPRAGMVTPLNTLSGSGVTHFGGLLSGAGSQLFGYGSTGSGLNPPQNTLYSIDITSGQASRMVSKAGTGDVYSDGCACAYAFSFRLTAPAEGIYCNNDSRTFTLTINNGAVTDIAGVTLRDTFPRGMIIQNVSATYVGDIVPGTGVGTAILALDNLLIPAKSSVQIDVEIQTVDAIVEGAENQAWLTDLPERFGGAYPSDDPATVGGGPDASFFYVIARELDDIVVDITPPSDCVVANDGIMRVTSDVFVPGQALEVGIRNQIGWEVDYREVVIDASNSFVLDSLIPGDYQIFSIRSIDGNCSLAVKDSTFLVEPPNEQLQLTISANGPLCEGEQLMLQSEQSPGGSIRWTGPALFGSEDIDPVIDSVAVAQGGVYKALAKYGFCEQERELEVVVEPKVFASLVGDTVYCLRDTLRLQVEASEDSLSYEWAGPLSYKSIADKAVLPIDTAGRAGLYRLIARNAACADTISQAITILPTPTLSLPEVVSSDFCDDVVLEPEVIGDSDVSYTWSSGEGLSCSDCPEPSVVPVVQPSYQLVVRNVEGCADSAIVRIQLDKEVLATAPTAFRPSSRVGNDKFAVVPRCVVDELTTMTIYDRWGSAVYTYKANTALATPAWDGTIMGAMASSGAYTWYAVVRLIDGSSHGLNGSVILLE